MDQISEKPYIASHSNAKAVCRCSKESFCEQIRAIAKKGGVIGLNMYPGFLRDNGTPNISDVLSHAEHIIRLVGDDYLGFGCDFDGIDTTPEGICGVSAIASVILEMEKRFGRETAEKIAEKNFSRVLGEVLK